MVGKRDQDLSCRDAGKDVVCTRRCPEPKLFAAFREQCGWGTISVMAAEVAIRNSLFFVCAEIDNKIVGFGRVVGDGVLNYYIQDMIVDPQFRGRSIGSAILSELVHWIRQDCRCDATIGLMAAAGREGFYRRHGFKKRPNTKYGAGMTMIIQPGVK